MAKTAQQVTQKWLQNLSSSTQAIQDGVNAVTVAPTQKAAEQSALYLQNVMAAVQSGKYQQKLQAVTLDQWRQAFLQKGLPRVATGAQAAQNKMQSFMTKWLPVMQAASDQVKAMPKGTTDAALARIRVVLDA